MKKEKPEDVIAQCPHCLAVRNVYKKRPDDWQQSIVVFEHLKKEICFSCKKKNIGNIKNWKHQQRVIDMNQDKMGIFHGTGTGKTFICLQLARGKTLVIAPKTQVEQKNWESDLKKLGIKLDLTVISKETFRRDWEKLPKYDTVIGEECHTLLGVTPSTKWVQKQEYPKTSQLFDNLRKYLLRNNPKRVYLCSATPAPQPMAVWGAGVLLGRFLYESFYKFRSVYYFEIPKGHFTVWIPRKDQATKDRLISTIKGLGDIVSLQDCFDVPEQTFVTRYVEPTVEQKKLSNELETIYPDPLVLRTKRYAVDNGVYKTFEVEKESDGTEKIIQVTKTIKSNKIAELDRIVEEFDKVLIFANFTRQVEDIAKYFEKEGKRVLVLTGATKNRGELLKLAENGKPCVFIAQSSVSAGYELPSFPCVVWASLSGKHLDYVQGQGRVLRGNALKKNVYIHLVTKGTVDEKAYNTIMDKQDFHLQLTQGEKL